MKVINESEIQFRGIPFALNYAYVFSKHFSTSSYPICARLFPYQSLQIPKDSSCRKILILQTLIFEYSIIILLLRH